MTAVKLACLPVLALLFFFGNRPAEKGNMSTANPPHILTILFSKASNIYYYENELEINENMNNFKSSTSKLILKVAFANKHWAAENNKPFEISIKTYHLPSLNKSAVYALDSLKRAYTYTMVQISEEEKQLVDISDEYIKKPAQ